MEKNIKVRVTAYKDFLVIETENPEAKADYWVPRGDGRIGCIIMGQERLEVSEEALALLRNIKKSRDAIGDVMWWKAGDKVCFGWFGAPRWILRPAHCEGDRDYAAREHVVIPNSVPEVVRKALDDPDETACDKALNDWVRG